ncbi:MAG: hypothetical protein KatS3mg110_1305 [Pirellulaceae bacterium]|nr:MAG: hypothetical protein KatS3mg110_1305 [Pirellulaceae bacterium]
MHSACLVLLALLSEPGTSADLLRWKLAEGESYRIEVRVQSQSAATVNKLVKKVASHQELRLSWQVEGTDAEGNFRIVQRIERLRWRLEGEGGRVVIDYDSDAPPADEQARRASAAVAALVGKSLRVVLSPRGEIISAVPDADFQEALRELEDKENLLYLFSAEGLSAMLAQAMPILPEQAVVPGDKWQLSRRLALAFAPATQKSEYVVIEPSDADRQAGLLPIDVTSQVELEPAEGVSLKITEQHTEGRLIFDVVHGRYLSARFKQLLVTETPFRDDVARARVETAMELTVQPVK